MSLTLGPFIKQNLRYNALQSCPVYLRPHPSPHPSILNPQSSTLSNMEIHRSSSNYRPYPPPRKNVLLLSCMDLRLIDDLVPFMEGDNLSNRYDQLVFAG